MSSSNNNQKSKAIGFVVFFVVLVFIINFVFINNPHKQSDENVAQNRHAFTTWTDPRYKLLTESLIAQAEKQANNTAYTAEQRESIRIGIPEIIRDGTQQGMHPADLLEKINTVYALIEQPNGLRFMKNDASSVASAPAKQEVK